MTNAIGDFGGVAFSRIKICFTVDKENMQKFFDK